MSGCINRKALHVAYLIRGAVFEERIKLRAVTLKFGALIEDFAEGFLDDQDFFTNADFSAQLVLPCLPSL